jgi:spectinomycin phosphotransferase
VQTLQVYWRLEVIQLDYLAVGFGAHHWRATTPTGARYFLALHELGHAGSTVDYRTAARAQLQRALGAARWLETSAELDFVVGPVPDVWSTCCRPVSDRFALSLYPWLDCDPMRHRDDPRTADVLARSHAVAPRMPPGLGEFPGPLLLYKLLHGRASVDNRSEPLKRGGPQPGMLLVR